MTSVSPSASHEYRGWLPGLFDEQLYLSSSRVQKAADRVRVARTENTSDNDGRLVAEDGRKTLGYHCQISQGGAKTRNASQGRPGPEYWRLEKMVKSTRARIQ